MRCWWPAIVFVLLGTGVRAEVPVSKDGKDPEDPRFTPTVKWLPRPFPVKNAAASVEGEMKPYAEQISGTDVGYDMVPIPAGEFLMGSPADEPMREADEGPQHRVRIEPFWMGKHEVTWNEFDLYVQGLDYHRRMHDRREPTKWDIAADATTCTSMTPYDDPMFGKPRDGYPAVNMTQLAAKLYCTWLSAKTGRYYPLPTEAGWEYACRAGTTTA